MDARIVAGSLLVGLSLLAVLPIAGGHGASASDRPAALAGVAPSIIAPVHGTVTNCTSQAVCVYSFSTALGTGWANSSESRTYVLTMALELPGESSPSFNLTYGTSTAKVTTSYPTTTYWTVGTFLGTDVNSGHIIYGTTNTNFSATCHPVYRWCHYTYATLNGTIVVHFTNAEATSTAIACSPTTIHPQTKTTCSVTLTDLWNASHLPTGKVHLSDGGSGIGTFSNKGTCALINASCSFTFKASDNACGGIALSATYAGNSAFYKSGASIAIDVYVSGGC